MSQSEKIIALFVPSLRGGGAERVMVNLANVFADRGFSVDLVLATAVGQYISEVSPAVNIVDFRCSRVLTSLPRLLRYLRQRNPIALLSAMGHANLIALLASQLLGNKTRILVSEHNNSSVELNSSKNMRSQVMNYLNRFLYPLATEIIAVSNGVAQASSKRLDLPSGKIKVIYNPVVSSQILERAEQAVNYKWLSKDSRPLIVGAGRLVRQKDFPTLIRSFARVRRNLDVRLVIMGEGELRMALERLVCEHDLQEHVVFPGFVDNPFAVMKQADLFVLSSAWEGLGNVLIEAMTCGTPVVSTNCPSGPAEILENGKWGRLVPVGNVEALANAMIETLTETQHPDVVQRAAYFSVDRAAEEYLRLLLPDTMK